MKTNLLFITWDGPQTSYMEGLFMPIFHEISKREKINFHVMQFTWAEQEKKNRIKKTAETFGIKYTALPILRKPAASLGSFITVQTSIGKIKKYIKENNIDIVMPRSTFPSMMINKIPKKNLKIIFDADGLPIEERIDFSGLKRNSFLYKFLKSAEIKMLKNADAVITRSKKSIDIHLDTIGKEHEKKFSVVFNGRDQTFFAADENSRKNARKELGLNDEFLFVYAGSLGSQYCLPEMLEIFEQYDKKHSSGFLILTGNMEFAKQHIPENLVSKIIIKKVESHEVPFYLNAADFAFALRKPAFSMQGVAPIKLGEYLLCGIPVIASKGIGDTEEILKNFEECYLFDHSQILFSQPPSIINFIEKSIFATQRKISEKATFYFSLEAAAKSYITAINKVINVGKKHKI
jgi:glycosyltransferase involved in cell wall biosynthesis